MKFAPLLFLTITMILSMGCNKNKQAEKIYTEAEKSYSEKEYNKAKLLIDSLLTTHPDNIEFITRSKDLLRTISKAEQENNLTFLDSLLAVKEKELAPLLKNFEESMEVGETPVLIHKRQKIENSFSRSFVMAYLNKAGEFYLSSRYVGKQRIHHNRIRVYHQSLSAESEIIEEDGLLNRAFDDGEWHWEIINYKNNRDNGIADLISNHYDKPLKVEYIGKSRHYIVMEQYDKEAIRDAYEISFLLRETAKIREQIEIVKNTLKQF